MFDLKVKKKKKKSSKDLGGHNQINSDYGADSSKQQIL